MKRNHRRQAGSWPQRAYRRFPKFSVIAGLLLGSATVFIAWFVSGPKLPDRLSRIIVNDVTQLNPVVVERIAFPRSVQEVQELVREHPGPIAIGGGHYSMGGQTACEGCLSLDMRKLDHVLELDVAHKTIRVQAGITWRKIQSVIDPHGLAVSIMQTYSNFTVGGALSVNCHGRYIGEGPVIRSVQEIELVLADGSLVRASATENSALFYGAIGGYGGLGVIVTAKLALAENLRIQRKTVAMPVTEYGKFFAEHVRNAKSAVFHNADLYPPDYDFVRAQTWAITKHELSDQEHFIKPERPSALERAFLYWVTELPLGKALRQHVYEPWILSEEPVVLRNHEASYDVMSLEPASRADSTFVLQEYFVPVEHLDAFVPKLREVLQKYDVNALNVSIRHALPDPGSLLAWARTETFAFVLYYKQGTDAESKKRVGEWTRAAVDAVLSVGGAYYLPYQPHATLRQLKQAYPRFDEWVALKRKVDPHYRFRNKLWDTYLPPEDDLSLARARLHAAGDALRSEGQTFLTLPEWYIVFSAEEYQRHLASKKPSTFPYFASNGQFWSLYRQMYGRTKGSYPPNFEYHVMNMVIGASFSLENAIKGVYEGSIGRVSEWFACPGASAGGSRALSQPPVSGEWKLCNAEDAYAAKVAAEYDHFIRTYPWYEFSYKQKLAGLWSLDTSHNHSWVRTLERRLFLSLEYGAKALYAAAIGSASHSAFGVEELTTSAWLHRADGQAMDEHVKVLSSFGEEDVVLMPRYEGFRDALAQLTRQGITLHEVAGNERIALTLVVPRGLTLAARDYEVTTRWPVLTDPSKERVMLFTPVTKLGTLISELSARGASVDHVFDF
jgi:FAD/FMN-containing dehydrogenase